MTTQTLSLTPTETVTIVRDDAGGLVVEAQWPGGSEPPPPHHHPAQDERFTVLEGQLTAKLGGAEQVLTVGDVLEIPRGTVHQMFNASAATARARWETTPGGRTSEWFRALDAQQRAGNVGRKGVPPLPVLAALLTEYDDVIVFDLGPRPLLYGVLRVLAPLGRRRVAPTP